MAASKFLRAHQIRATRPQIPRRDALNLRDMAPRVLEDVVPAAACGVMALDKGGCNSLIAMNVLSDPICLASIACNGPRFIKKLKSMAKGLAKKIAGALKAAKDQYVSGSLRSLIAPGAYYHRNKTSNEATRRSPTASPAIRPRTRSEEKDEKERARLLAPLLRSDA
ncbi:unnamed protein product [Aureobasidium pullulans]|nr:unnamed protein product [Aureobasidium pullulans]